MRKILVVATIAVLIGLLACAGPAPTPDTVGTRLPAKSEAMAEETATEASGQITTETPDRIDAGHVSNNHRLCSQGHDSAHWADIDARANDTGAQSDEPGWYGCPYPCDKPSYVGPHHGGCDLNPGADTHDNAGLYERASTSYHDPNHSRVPHPFGHTGLQ